jgi:Raf kinase inhibitor-like YbhB/YbcL family protein
MSTGRRIALPVLAGFLFLLLAGTIASSTFAHAQGLKRTDPKLQPFTLSSPNFRDGEPLPLSSEGNQFGCNGKNSAPTFKWENVPVQTSGFVLVMSDADAPLAEGFRHWIVYNIPATATTLQGNAPYTQGTTSVPNTQGTPMRTYFGPCPQDGTGQVHHYIFTLYALNKIDHLQQDGLTYDELIQAIKGHVGGATTIVGTFRRVPPGKDAH